MRIGDLDESEGLLFFCAKARGGESNDQGQRNRSEIAAYAGTPPGERSDAPNEYAPGRYILCKIPHSPRRMCWAPSAKQDRKNGGDCNILSLLKILSRPK